MHFIRMALIASLFALPLVHQLGCSSSPACADCDAFATYQDCWNEHSMVEGFSVQRAIEICCIDHPIGNAAMNTVCGDTAATCTTYVTANLTDAADADLTTDISTACTDYVVDRAG